MLRLVMKTISALQKTIKLSIKVLFKVITSSADLKIWENYKIHLAVVNMKHLSSECTNAKA